MHHQHQEALRKLGGRLFAARPQAALVTFIGSGGRRVPGAQHLRAQIEGNAIPHL
jgi:hypothetical protein